MDDKPNSADAAARFAEPTLCINGEWRQLRVDTRRTLLELLRGDCGLRAAKRGCDMGNCGACTVLLDGAPAYACLILAVECEGQRVDTAEARDPLLERLRQAFLDHDAYQCGYCTPGQLLSLCALLRESPRADEAAIRAALTGNLCRCGAYSHILAAALEVAAEGFGA